MSRPRSWPPRWPATSGAGCSKTRVPSRRAGRAPARRRDPRRVPVESEELRQRRARGVALPGSERERGARRRQPQRAERTALAVLDLVSHDSDPLLVWTNDPWPYLNLKRVSATRFFYKRFLLGEIYLGRTSNATTCSRRPGDWFARRPATRAIRSRTCSSARRRCRAAIRSPTTCSATSSSCSPTRTFRSRCATTSPDRCSRRRRPRTGTAAAPNGSRSGWKVDGNDARYEQGPAASADDQLTLSTRSCFRLDGVIPADAAGTLGHVALPLLRQRGQERAAEPLVRRRRTRCRRATSSTSCATPTDIPVGRRPGAVLVGRRSPIGRARDRAPGARRVVASEIGDGDGRGDDPVLDLADLRVGTAPTGSGC